MIKWHRIYYVDARHAARRRATSSPPTCCFVLFRLATTCAVFMLVLAPFGVFATWWGAVLAFARRRCWSGMAFADARSTRFTRPADDPRRASALLFRLGVIPLFLFSGAFFPIANLGPVLEWVARLHAAVARRRPVPDVHASTPSTGRWPRSTSPTSSC